MSNALQQLMRERLDREGWSYGEVARRGDIPRSTVHHLATSERLVRMPQPATLEGLARGLELPLDAVRRAAAEACGIHLYAAGPAPAEGGRPAADPEVDVLIASLQKLSVDDRRHVAALVESLLGKGAGVRGDQDGRSQAAE
ncbi:transcriptional regulator [Streptacidiphilus sp. PB12-B1b]|uniref:helix-turn-helix domain-containing protein n=1 Tax=Streptacidiphilus sp. PB12-B1b TaxID=2705012 RepID=UPI0015FAA392|nr:transcriptional regulator [Streptacidiphilus sp. PB12-B1b]QMU79449.1 transcriptional regulator [Streptacidiphilus sp. PB12-B1b]